MCCDESLLDALQRAFQPEPVCKIPRLPELLNLHIHFRVGEHDSIGGGEQENRRHDILSRGNLFGFLAVSPVLQGHIPILMVEIRTDSHVFKCNKDSACEGSHLVTEETYSIGYF